MRWLAFGRGVGVLLLGVRPTRCRTVDSAKPQGVDSTHQDRLSGGRSPAGRRRAGASLTLCSAGALLDPACPTRLGVSFRWSSAGRFLARGSLGVVRAGSSATLAWPPAGFVLARRPLDRSPVQRRPAGCWTWLGLVGQTARGGVPAGRPAGSWLTVRWSGAARALGARPIGEKPDAVGRCRRAAGLGRASLSLLVVGGWSGSEPGGRSWTGLGSELVRPTRSGFRLRNERKSTTPGLEPATFSFSPLNLDHCTTAELFSLVFLISSLGVDAVGQAVGLSPCPAHRARWSREIS